MTDLMNTFGLGLGNRVILLHTLMLHTVNMLLYGVMILARQHTNHTHAHAHEVPTPKGISFAAPPSRNKSTHIHIRCSPSSPLG